MKTASISDAKNNLSALLKEVRGGATVVITDHGVPVARLAPVEIPRGIPARALELAQQGLLTLPGREPTAKWLDLPLPKLGPGPDPVDVVLEERREGW
jgi:prevent-host-death family protein